MSARRSDVLLCSKNSEEKCFLARRTNALALGVIVVVLVVVGWIATAPDPFVPLVEGVVRTPQTYDGEHIDKLVKLGAEAVPAIGKVLLAGEKFPFVFVSALERIGDERGTEPILEFVSKQTPYSDVDRSTLTAKSILALRGIPNTDACEPVASILRNEAAHPRVRLASASTCARLCSRDTRAEAQRFILKAYQDRSRYLAYPNEGLLQHELYSALIDVDNAESLAILLNLVEYGGSLHTMQSVIIYLARKDEEQVAETLQRVLNDSAKHELPVRLAAARALLDSGKPPSQSLRDGIDELANEARPDLYGQDIADEAQELRARAAEPR
jgi:hypothetical protein